jgi:hypothetical protein
LHEFNQKEPEDIVGKGWIGVGCHLHCCFKFLAAAGALWESGRCGGSLKRVKRHAKKEKG